MRLFFWGIREGTHHLCPPHQKTQCAPGRQWVSPSALSERDIAQDANNTMVVFDLRDLATWITIVTQINNKAHVGQLGSNPSNRFMRMVAVGVASDRSLQPGLVDPNATAPKCTTPRPK